MWASRRRFKWRFGIWKLIEYRMSLILILILIFWLFWFIGLRIFRSEYGRNMVTRNCSKLLIFLILLIGEDWKILEGVCV